MRHPVIIILLLILISAGIAVFVSDSNIMPENSGFSFNQKPILIDMLKDGDAISSPITITGQAKGPWFFEGVMNVVIVDWDGLIIGEGNVSANGDWMVEGYVPFDGVINFKKPIGGASDSGTIIFKKGNPSGLPEKDATFEISVIFR